MTKRENNDCGISSFHKEFSNNKIVVARSVHKVLLVLVLLLLLVVVVVVVFLLRDISLLQPIHWTTSHIFFLPYSFSIPSSLHSFFIPKPSKNALIILSSNTFSDSIYLSNLWAFGVPSIVFIPNKTLTLSFCSALMLESSISLPTNLQLPYIITGPKDSHSAPLHIQIINFKSIHKWSDITSSFQGMMRADPTVAKRVMFNN